MNRTNNDFLFDPSFQRVNRLFVLSFENEAKRRTNYKRYYLCTKEIENSNVMIDGQNFFWSTNKKYVDNI